MTDKYLECFKTIETKFPQQCRTFYPRRIAAPGSHYSPRGAAGFLMALEQSFYVQGRVEGELLQQHALTAHIMAKNRVPTFFVKRELLVALQDSGIDETIKLEDLHWPFNGLLFIFPHQLVPGIRDFIPYLILTRQEAGRHRLETGRPGPNFIINLEQEVTALHFTDTFHPTEYTMAWPTNRTLKPLIDQEELENLEGGMPMDDNEEAVSRRIFILAVKLLLVANASPELVTQGEIIPTKKKSAVIDPKDDTALYAPNWFSYPASAPHETFYRSRPENGTLIRHSPRFHLRRGHFKKQPHGPHHSLRKIIWIKPTTVGHGKAELSS
jgi:hypothetical protein